MEAGPASGFWRSLPGSVCSCQPASDLQPESAGAAGCAHKDRRTRKEDRSRLAWRASHPLPVIPVPSLQEQSWGGVWTAGLPCPCCPSWGDRGHTCWGSSLSPGQWLDPAEGSEFCS